MGPKQVRGNLKAMAMKGSSYFLKKDWSLTIRCNFVSYTGQFQPTGRLIHREIHLEKQYLYMVIHFLSSMQPFGIKIDFDNWTWIFIEIYSQLRWCLFDITLCQNMA